MAQHKMKQKVTLPGGVRKSSKVNKKTKAGPKRGLNKVITPKNQRNAEEARVQKNVTRIINQQNDELIAAQTAGPSNK